MPTTSADKAPTNEDGHALSYSLSTLGIHADDRLNSETDVAPSLHVSTTFRYPSDPNKLEPVYEDVCTPYT